MTSCKYCNEPATLRCAECDLYFCNNTTGEISHAVFHLVINKHCRVEIDNKAVECKQCGDSNIFRLGTSEETSSEAVELFCRECKEVSQLINNKIIKGMESRESELKHENMKRLENPTLPRIKLRSDAQTYVETLIKLINTEKEKEKEIKEAMKQENVTLRVEGNHCYFHFARPASGLRMSIGDEIKFTHKTGITFVGTVAEDQFTEELKVYIKESDVPKTGYTVESIWSGVCYKRMCWALKKLYKERRSNVIFQYVLQGRADSGERNSSSIKECQVLEPNEFQRLNEAQKLAVKAALSRELTLIQGPPGTGKTIVSAVIVYNFVKQFKKKVLVVAPSNTAVDQLALQINNTGLKVLRVMSRRRESKSSTADFLCLHNLLREFKQHENAKYELLKAADVVCCTCVTAGQQLFNNHSFPFVLIDEAVQSTEPLSLIPCVYGAVKLVMVGDHKQLGPTILSQDAARCGLRRSLFERLLQIGVSPYLLTTQYRMHPELCQFPSEYFYGGQLQTGAFITKRVDFPNNFFYACHGKEEISQSGTSFLNRAEALMVENIIRFLFKKGVRESQIGVITPYEGQRSYLLGKIFGNEPGKLEIANVDAFQGREKDFIIVSLVRSNSFQGIGFVADRRRMNVALTRAKYGLAIVGNPFTFCKNGMWAKLLKWYDERGSIYEGPVEALRRTSLQAFDVRELSEALV